MPRVAKPPGRKPRKPRARKPAQRSSGGITFQQYETAWELYHTKHNAREICAAAGLSKPEFDWLVRDGDPSVGMIPLEQRAAELSAKRRAEALRAVEAHARHTAKYLEQRGTGANAALAHVYKILALAGKAAESAESADDAAMSRETLATIRELLRVADRGMVDATRVMVSALVPILGDQVIAHLPRDMREHLPLEVMVPASMTAQLGPTVAADDPITRSLPNYAEWTDEERLAYAQTGVMPRKALAPAAAKKG